MDTRIRELRRQRGLTLKELADLSGTTPQTVQRLETANMTVSTDWLERIAAALEVRPIELLADFVTDRVVPVIGAIGRNGRLMSGEGPGHRLIIDVPARDPLAVVIGNDCGPYRTGVHLVAGRLTGANMRNAIGRDCLVAPTEGTQLLRRVVAGGAADTFTLVPLIQGEDVIYDAHLDWAAPVIMAIRYF